MDSTLGPLQGRLGLRGLRGKVEFAVLRAFPGLRGVFPTIDQGLLSVLRRTLHGGDLPSHEFRFGFRLRKGFFRIELLSIELLDANLREALLFLAFPKLPVARLDVRALLANHLLPRDQFATSLIEDCHLGPEFLELGLRFRLPLGDLLITLRERGFEGREVAFLPELAT